MRKIIQIAVTPHSDCISMPTVLCNDGTLWTFLPNPKDNKWKQYPEIPQDKYTESDLIEDK